MFSSVYYKQRFILNKCFFIYYDKKIVDVCLLAYTLKNNEIYLYQFFTSHNK